MTRRDSARDESFARSFKPHDPSGQPNFFGPHYHTPEARTELQLAYDVAERRGLATTAAVRKALAAMPAFAGLAATGGNAKLELATV